VVLIENCFHKGKAANPAALYFTALGEYGDA
jgi:hypothetical protein